MPEWNPSVQQMGLQPIADTSTVQNHPVGTIIRARSETYGEGEFIYLKGVVGTLAGLLVSWNLTTYQTILGVTVELVPRPIGIAMSANVASQWGWYQISGYNSAVGKASGTSFAAGAAVGLASSATGLAVAASSGNTVMGAIVAVVASAKTGVVSVAVSCNRMHLTAALT